MAAFIGLGNSGSKFLLALYKFLNQEGVPLKPNTRFLIGDADTNNSVLYEVRKQRLDVTTPPHQIEVMSLADYWSGGCGVYHIIGELLAQTAVQDPEFREMLERWWAQEIVMLLSAGGGTGGGVGGYLLEAMPAFNVNAANIRLFVALPEVDQFVHPGPEVNGPDGFQCASAGRFLLRFLGQAALAREGKNALATSDLFLMSNSYLSCMPEGVGYQEGVDRLNRYLSHAVTLMPSVAAYPAANHVAAFGLGAAPRAQPGTAAVQPARQLAEELIRSALSPLDLKRTSPVGLSALPMDLEGYRRCITAMLGGPDGGPDAAKLRGVFRRCLGVTVQFWHNPNATSAADAAAVFTSVKAQLVALFGPNVKVSAHNGGAADPAHLPDTDQPGVTADYALLLLMDDLIIDDVFRLVTYFLQSSFSWADGSVQDVAELVEATLTDPDTTPPLIAQALTTVNGAPRPPGNRVRLAPNARERYPARFWGNIDDLRSKVLQSLDRNEAEFEARLLGVSQLAAGLGYFHSQVWRYR